MLLEPLTVIAVICCAVGSYGLAAALVRAGSGFAMDVPGKSIQSYHRWPTPRLGGIGIFLGTLIAYALAREAAQREILKTVILAGAPVLAIGLVEDFTQRVGVRMRLLATFAAGTAACATSGVHLTGVHVIGFDTLLHAPWLAIAFTAFAVAGVANAVNIIDGCHGLASGTVVICLLAISAIAQQAGDSSLALASVTMVAVVAGFCAVNFPLGKLFLGDGGAYFTGFVLGWFAVLMPTRNPAVSPWASLLVCAYPVIEVMYSVARRALQSRSAAEPDREHLHSLVAADVVPRRLPCVSPDLQNSCTSVLMWCVAAVPAVTAVVAYRHTSILIPAVVVAAVLYHWLYRKVRHG
jgi:UDP-N-acetylmuramyl pentapeptide phosphotransferase/UDP-N-acetylglucosamine-1-phosphate transferase